MRSPLLSEDKGVGVPRRVLGLGAQMASISWESCQSKYSPCLLEFRVSVIDHCCTFAYLDQRELEVRHATVMPIEQFNPMDMTTSVRGYICLMSYLN